MFSIKKGTDLSQENKHFSHFTTTLLFHTKPDLIQLPQNLTLPFQDIQQRLDPVPHLQLQLLLGSAAVLWAGVKPGSRFLCRWGCCTWSSSSRQEHGSGARARTKLALKPHGFQTQLRHSSLARGLLQIGSFQTPEDLMLSTGSWGSCFLLTLEERKGKETGWAIITVT